MFKFGLIGLVVICFLSCQKELSLENANSVPPPPDTSTVPPPDTLGDLLVRAVTKYSASDSVVELYSYDGAKRLIGVNTTGTVSGTDISNSETIKRDGSGNITQIVIVNAQVGGTLTTDVFFDALNNRYSHSVIRFTFNGSTYVDSTVFVYNAAGLIIETNDYQEDPVAGYQLTTKHQYTYSGASIDSVKLYNVDLVTGNADWISALAYGYDGKTNPLVLSNGDAILLSLPSNFSPNNNNSVKSIDVHVPTNGFTVTNNFTYNSKNKPVTVVATQSPGGASYSGTFYYQ